MSLGSAVDLDYLAFEIGEGIDSGRHEQLDHSLVLRLRGIISGGQIVR